MAAFRVKHVSQAKNSYRDYQESVTTGQTHRWPVGRINGQMLDKVIPMRCYDLQATQLN